MIYVPDLSYSCYVVVDEDTIRAYESTPTYNSTINYRDYYINSHYIYKDSSVTFGNYSSIPTCIDSSLLTDDFYYRNDFADILIIFVIICIFGFYLPIKIFSKLFKRSL